ncbi:MAG: vWA domain-containing protein [Pseudomonadota bacterium]
MNLAFSHPLVLWLLPLALLPLWLRREESVSYSSLALLPDDSVSRLVAVLLRVAPALLIGLLVLGLAGLHRPPQAELRTGSGAQIVMLLDRSRSMDQTFAAGRRRADYRNTAAALAVGNESKGAAARRLLQEFVARRQDDMYAMTIFSSSPIPVLSLTESQEMIQAAISAGNVGRGLASTDIGAGLFRALSFFDGRDYTGSRLIMLISDGGAKLDVATRLELRNLFRKHQVTLYWLYVRSGFSDGIFGTDAKFDETTAPARALHTFFQQLDTPYRAYDAEDSEALERAIDDVNRLQSLPIVYEELSPRLDLAAYCFAAGLPLALLLLIAHALQVRSWSIP